MKSIANQYRDLKEGKMTQYNFMRSLRMSMPQYITNVTSFKDAVKILKNKAILNESNRFTNPDEPDFAMAVADQLDNEKWGLTDEQLTAADAYLEDNAYDLQGDFANTYSVDGGSIAAAKFIVSKIKGSEDENADIEDLLKQYGEEEAGKYTTGGEQFEISEAKKKEAKKELHPNQIHPQELRMGIKVELEHTDDLDKAKKIALDHLAENPFYYTALKLAGVESPSAPKVKASKAAKKEKAVEGELTDKENAMKPVKGFEKAKASSNKVRKETNSGVKGVEELTHNAKSVRGLQKFAATGGKMKTVKEGQLNEAGGEWTITGTLTKDELDKLKDIIGDYGIDVQETDDTYETTISHKMYNDKALEQALKQARGMLSQKPQFGNTIGFDDTLQSKLESLVREVLDEMYDGRDNMLTVSDYKFDEK